jgi:RNA-binding protein
MRRAGEAVRTAQGLVVVRTPPGEGGRLRPGEDVPDIGVELVDESLTPVGRVVDVFGPVERPYLAVEAGSVDPVTLLGRPLYAR